MIEKLESQLEAHGCCWTGERAISHVASGRLDAQTVGHILCRHTASIPYLGHCLAIAAIRCTGYLTAALMSLQLGQRLLLHKADFRGTNKRTGKTHS